MYNGETHYGCIKEISGTNGVRSCAINSNPTKNLTSHGFCKLDCPNGSKKLFNFLKVKSLNKVFLQFAVCREQEGGCNLQGTKGCSPDGKSCECRPGYIGKQCQYCVPDALIVSGGNGTIPDENGQGVKCSK